MESRRVIKVAVVGSGLAGLSAAYLLATTKAQSGKPNAEFESLVLGMDSESLTVKIPPGSANEKNSQVRVDVPMRSVLGGAYPKLMRLYERLGVALKQHDYSYSFSSFGTIGSTNLPMTTRMIYNGASGRAGVGLPSGVYATSQYSAPLSILEVVFNAIKWILDMLSLVFHYARLYLLSNPSCRAPTHLCRETLRTWAKRTTQNNTISRLLGWEAFVADIIVPLFSAVCTTTVEDVWEHPVAEILDYIWLGFGTHHYVATHGVQDVVSRLSSPLPPQNIHLDAEVKGLSASGPLTASVTFDTAQASSSQARTISGFSHIILATPTQLSARLLQSFASSLPQNSSLRVPLAQATQRLSVFRTRKAVVITHQDDSVLPSHRNDWRDLNLVMEVPSSPLRDVKTSSALPLTPGCAMATHIFPVSSGPPLCQTTNPVILPSPESILSQSVLDRSVLTVESKVARDSFCRVSEGDESEWIKGDLQGLRLSEGEKSQARVWMCGAWAYGGIPLLEGCVGSAEIVVKDILKVEGFEAPLV